MPVVQKSSRQCCLDTLRSRRTAYPTVEAPTRSPRSAATRSATEMAEMRRGCVQMIEMP